MKFLKTQFYSPALKLRPYGAIQICYWCFDEVKAVWGQHGQDVVFLPARRYAARYDSVCLSQMKVLSKRLNGSNSFMARRLQYPRVIVHCFWLEFRYLQNNGTFLWNLGLKSGLGKFRNSMWIVGSSHRMWCVMDGAARCVASCTFSFPRLSAH